MKKTYMFVLAIAVTLYCAPAFAQHGGGRPAVLRPSLLFPTGAVPVRNVAKLGRLHLREALQRPD